MAKMLRKKTETTAEPHPMVQPGYALVPDEFEPPDDDGVDRQQVMKEYSSRQYGRGHRQVKLWVPESSIPWLKRLVEDMRQLAEMGFDPLTAHEHLPAAQPLPGVLLMRKNWSEPKP